VATYNTSDFRKGLKVQMDGEPYLVVEYTFRKPGKGQAVYTLRMKNLIRNTVIERNYRSGDSIEAADVEEVEGQFLYRQGDVFVFMNTATYDQYEVSEEAMGDAWKYIKEGMAVSITLYNGLPISVMAPNHVVLRVVYCEPGARGNTATNVTKPCKLETGAEIPGPSFINIDDLLRVDTRTGEYIERVKE
jgi:elongation factor P